jgi:thiamine-phosphate pyrophosphorylase
LLSELPRIYPITDTAISGLPHADQVRLLAEGGARLIQLREKAAPSGNFYTSAVASLGAAREAGAKLIINDRVDIALMIKADGVHLGQDDLPPQHARKMLGDDAFIGYSTHDLDQAIEGALLPVDYIALGPIFPTSSKENPDKVVGLDLLKRVRDRLPDVQLVAIGGITPNNVAEVFAAGADSAAVISSLLRDPSNIAARLRNFEVAAA